MRNNNLEFNLTKEAVISNHSSSKVRIYINKVLQVLPENLQNEILKNKFLRRTYHQTAKKYRELKGKVKPYKSPRVFVKKGISRQEFFTILNDRKIDYVLLRWWENFPEIPEGEDMDILIEDGQRESIQDLLTYYDNGTGLKCDIYTITGSKYGAHKGIPYYQSNLAHHLLESRVLFRGVYVPSPLMYFASLTYHALFHKGANSGLEGFSANSSQIEHDYSKVLSEQMPYLELEFKPHVENLYNWLRDQNYVPAEDTLSKLVEIKPELAMFQTCLSSDIRGGELIVYVLRERLLEDKLMNDLMYFLKDKFCFDILDFKILDSDEKKICSRHIRGGKWDKGPFKHSGGEPAALLSVFDYHPKPLSKEALIKQSRMTNLNNLKAKYAFRTLINDSSKIKKSNYNGVHSSDNEHDALYYISLLGNKYQKKLAAELETRRNRYTRNWNLVKLLTYNEIYKEEVINYDGQLALLKTFRPGKEKMLQEELSLIENFEDELSQDQQILKTGEGFVIKSYSESNSVASKVEDRI